MEIESKSPESHIEKLLENPHNKQCFECGIRNFLISFNLKKENGNIEWASINNGIFLCSNCGNKHKELGPNYSQIKPLNMNHLSLIDLLYLQTGGNNKLRNFFEGFNITNQNFTIENKYKTKASIYYRALVKTKSKIFKKKIVKKSC